MMASAAPTEAADERDALRAAAALHKAGNVEAAIHSYRSILSRGMNAHAAVLLANLLITPASAADAGARAAAATWELLPGMTVALRRSEAAILAAAAVSAAVSGGVASSRSDDRSGSGRQRGHCISCMPAEEAAKVYARHGYFLLQYHGIIRGALGAPDFKHPDNDEGGSDAHDESSAVYQCTEEQRAGLLQAIASLENATQLAPTVSLPWRHLSTAYTAAGKLKAAAEAAERAVTVAAAAGGAKAAWELHYRHGKALKRIGDAAGAVAKYCDALDADPTADLPLYWLRISSATPAAAAWPASVAQRVHGRLDKHAARLAALPAVPHEYIRKLFDGYAKHFDEHLTQALAYKTPNSLLRLALEVAAGLPKPATQSGITHASRPRPAWNACADLGCGTGLAGVEFRPYVRRMAGVDLSAGMVDEARARPGVYDSLDVGEVEAWLASQPEGVYDLAVCADVLVYIGPLEGVFSGVARVMRPCTAHAVGPSNGENDAVAPRLFVVSTEADLGDPVAAAGAAPSPGYKLSSTGRCVHARAYVEAAASAAGFAARTVVRQPIRRNAGADVIGDLYVFELVH